MLNDLDLTSFRDIHWKTQDSTIDSILFYRLAEGSPAEELFFERIKEAQFKALVINREISNRLQNIHVVPENDWPELQKKILDHLFPLPQIKYIGITGTNGKTTTTDLVLQLGELLGKKGLSIGTLGVRENQSTILDFGLTSPPFIDLRKYLFHYASDKDFCVMEASSHALVQERLFGITFDGGGFLSFSQDHLDYHGNMDEYFLAKKRLLEKLNPGAHLFVPSTQEDLYKKLKSEKVKKSHPVESSAPLFFKPKFNQENLEVAVSIIESVFHAKLNVELHKLVPPEGRFYIQAYRSNFIVVDFAHTPDALMNICKGLKETFPDHKLHVLFGCGGDRDRSKRPLMGKAASRYADKITVTSDNPRSEDPARIIEDILPGVSVPMEWTVDRPMAVQKALNDLKEKEVLLLAGKGHEDYILIKGVKYPYSDIREVDQFVAGKRHD